MCVSHTAPVCERRRGRAGNAAHGRRVARSWAACGSPPARSVARRPVPPFAPWHRPPSRPPWPPPCSKVLAAVGKEVKEFFGGNHSQAVLSQTTGVIVCTIEKANIM